MVNWRLPSRHSDERKGRGNGETRAAGLSRMFLSEG